MQSLRPLAGSLVALALAMAMLVALAISLAGSTDAADPGIDDMSIDMDPSATPANTINAGATTAPFGVVGSIETCARINENGIQDADEDAVDTLLIDITAKGIGPSDPVISFGATLNFPQALVKVVSVDVTSQLLSAYDGSAAGSASGAVPDTVSPYAVAGFDTGVDTFEWGDGTLAKIGIESVTASAGVGDLTLSAAGILGSGQYSPATLGAAKVAVNRACPGTPIQGDVDCNVAGNAVSATDALKVLRYVANLSVVQTEPCDDIGTGGPPVQGNVDCTPTGTLVTATDALKILRFVAGLTVVQNDPCPDIGTPRQ